MVVAVENGIYSCCTAQASGTFPEPSFRPRIIPQLSVSVINLAVSHERGAGTQEYLIIMWSITGEFDGIRSEPVSHWCTSRDVGRLKCIGRPWFSALPHGFNGAAPSLHCSTGRMEPNPLIECNVPWQPLQVPRCDQTLPCIEEYGYSSPPAEHHPILRLPTRGIGSRVITKLLPAMIDVYILPRAPSG